MKKVLCLLLAAVLCFGLVACKENVKAQPASDTDKQAVISAAKQCFESEAFVTAVELYETTFGEEATAPEIINALTFKWEDFNGIAVDFILFHVKADGAFLRDGETIVFDSVQFAVDRTTGTVYNSMELQDKMNNPPATNETMEDAAAWAMISSTLKQNTSDWVWTEMEESTRFTKSDIKEINQALAQ